MKKKVLKIVLCGVIILSITGCGNKKEETKKYEIKEESSGIIVVTDDKNVSDETKINVKEDTTDYSNINENINKYVAYDISLSNNNDIISIETESEVYLKIPNDYDPEKLVVYYILDNVIEETFDVEVIQKDKENYAMFKTNHFSIYVLAELKENVQIEDSKEDNLQENKENSIENTESDSNTNTSSNTNANNTSSNLTTVNLVGNWKCLGAETYYTFKSDGTGILYLNHTEETKKYTFTWSLKNKNLSIKYSDSGMGSISGEIKIYDENKIDIQPKKQLIYNRYYGEIPNKKIIEKDLTLKVNYINIPNGLELADNNSNVETVHVRTNDESLLSNTYTVTYDLSNCTLNSCSARATYNVPDEFTLSSTTVSKSVSLRNKRYYRDVNFKVYYTNFSDGYYNIESSKTVFKANVYADSETQLNNSTYSVYVDMSNNNTPGTWTVSAQYFVSGGARLTKEGLTENITVTVTEE